MRLKSTDSLDYEKKSSYNVRVTVQEEGKDFSYTQRVTVKVEDVNEVEVLVKNRNFKQGTLKRDVFVFKEDPSESKTSIFIAIGFFEYGEDKIDFSQFKLSGVKVVNAGLGHKDIEEDIFIINWNKNLRFIYVDTDDDDVTDFSIQIATNKDSQIFSDGDTSFIL